MSDVNIPKPMQSPNRRGALAAIAAALAAPGALAGCAGRDGEPNAPLASGYPAGPVGIPNIASAEYGITPDSLDSQTESIHQALDENPGTPFFFPPGNYRLDTQLNVSRENSILLAPGARLFAGAKMDTLVNFDNGASNVGRYAEDRCLSGYGQLDGNLLADRVLRINAVLRFSLEGVTLVDGIRRGLLTDELGAELHVRDIRIKNTSTKNIVDNIGIEARMNDSRFSNISMRDISIGVWDQGTNYWIDVHPWLGGAEQLEARYENSVAFVLQGNSVMVMPYSDTYRCAFRAQTDSGYARARIIAPEVYANPDNLTKEMASAYPGVVLDITDSGASILLSGGFLRGHPGAAFSFVSGSTRRLSAQHNTQPTAITGYADYRYGVKMGISEFTPTIFGSEAEGSQKYTLQSGSMEVRDRVASYRFKVRAELGPDISGNLRIGGLPIPDNVEQMKLESGGTLVTFRGGLKCDTVIGASGPSVPLVAIPVISDGGQEIDASSNAGREVEIWGQIDSTFDYPEG